MSKAASRMNVGLPMQLKRESDEIPAQLGWSTTQAVRAFWEFLVRNRNTPSAIPQILAGETPAEEESEEELDPEIQRKLALVEEGRRIYERFLAKYGLDASAREPKDDSYYDQLLHRAVSDGAAE